MAGKQNPKKPRKGKKKPIDWDAIREDYLLQNLDQSRDTPYTISALAKTWGHHRSTVEKHAKAESWREELITRAKAQANANLERRTETIAEVEREARTRHAAFCRGLVAKSMIKFNSLKDPENDISVDQMLKMLQFAMPEERASLGIPKYVSITTHTPTDTEREMETPGMKIERRHFEREVKKELLKVIAHAAEEDAAA